jgi:hypothetical protein
VPGRKKQLRMPAAATGKIEHAPCRAAGPLEFLHGRGDPIGGCGAP